jgi:hypothetical protein
MAAMQEFTVVDWGSHPIQAYEPLDLDVNRQGTVPDGAVDDLNAAEEVPDLAVSGPELLANPEEEGRGS